MSPRPGILHHLACWAATVALAVPALAYCYSRPFHHGVNVGLALIGVPGASVRVGFTLDTPLGEASTAIGDTVGGYTVSSEYGIRTHPVTGEKQKPHFGLDLATPTGTPVYALASSKADTTVRVSCWEDKFGGIIALMSADALPGQTIKLMHLKACYGGTHGQGAVIALSGATGRVTGPHLHVEQISALGKHKAPNAGIVSWLVTGKIPETAGAVAHSKLTDLEIICAVGSAEGTRDKDCDQTEAFWGHKDPGNGADNIGTFSYQHGGVATPEEADAKQLKKIRDVEKLILSRAADAGVTLNKTEILGIIDQFNQSEAAALGRNGTLDLIIKARSESYIDPDTGELDAPGLGNNMPQVIQDQTRRMEAIAESMRRQDKQP